MEHINDNYIKFLTTMKKILFYSFLTVVLAACKASDKDVTYPQISDDDFLPQDCAEYHAGEVMHVHFVCSDDTELGSFSIEIHGNFDHHTHGTSSVECEEHHEHGGEGASEPQGWVYNKDYAIPAGSVQYTGDIDIEIPADAAEGDYHFMLRLTDHAGWQTIKAVPIRIEE